MGSQVKEKIAYHTYFSPIAERFDAFIIDLWGVLHDGTHPYPTAIATLNELRKRNKKIILLSNAPRQSFKAEAVLQELGFPHNHYDMVLTSGQITHDWLREDCPWGKRYYYVGPPKDEDLITDLDFTQVMEPGDADFVLVTGFDNIGDPLESKLPQVERCLQDKLPMVCANPDRKVVKQDGRVQLCSGVLAEWYIKHGGEVEFFGKPYPKAYARCMEQFGMDDPSRVCGIGDSLHTDIAGANHAGIYSVLVAGGILANDLGITSGELPVEKALMPLCEQENTTPDAVIPVFCWDE